MYVKIFTQILGGSLSENRPLRHFFIDLLLCADQEGNVMITKEAIARQIKADLSEVEWGLGELMKPDGLSGTPAFGGRRVIPLDGRPYGWKIVNYEHYRDMKSSRQMLDDTARRVREYRERKKLEVAPKKRMKRPLQLPGEATNSALAMNGATEAELNRHSDSMLPEGAGIPEPAPEEGFPEI